MNPPTGCGGRPETASGEGCETSSPDAIEKECHCKSRRRRRRKWPVADPHTDRARPLLQHRRGPM